jgi:hypothetical protein
MRALSNGYFAEVDAANDATWRASIVAFRDANLYQVWQGTSVGDRSVGVSRLVLKKNRQVVAAAEIRLFLVPVIGKGIAYVRWGPLWRRPSDPHDADPLEHFRQVIRALRNEYVSQRQLVLRLNPRLFIEEHGDCTKILTDEGFSSLPGKVAERSLIMDLAPSLVELRANFDKKWRNCLNKAERGGLTVVRGTSISLFDEFKCIYTEMLRRKRFAPAADIERHRARQASLPPDLRMGILIARDRGVACAGAIYSALGDTAIYLFGATNESGMRTAGAYLVQWELLKTLKERGIRTYDLHGINHELNPGTYRFKKGLAGKTGKEVTFVGPSQAFERSISNHTLLLADRIYRRLQAPIWLRQSQSLKHANPHRGSGSNVGETTV